MALDTRRCFWFGTEDRAGFFATPLKGADSSPSAWGVDGTLLNGGGYGFNSFGSHKRYTYEWPQSSSPETAQIMKSYRDGTYGRGLLYFLEPGIYRTNILPAHWADPSMSLDNEAPSLVYGIDPIAVPTSGGSYLNLPINSAQYDLSSVPVQTVPTPDSSVFLPVPTGHTLFLGAFYSSTGAGGVFATPINSNGTLGVTVKLTEKSNADTDVVVDRFEGDIKGVRLWVGRSSAVDSSVTIAAMSGRLLETIDAVTYGPWSEIARNGFINPVISGTETTGWRVEAATGGTAAVSNAIGITPPAGIMATREVRSTWTVAPTSGFPALISPNMAVAVGTTVPYRFFARRATAGVLRIRLAFLQADGATASSTAVIVQTSPSLPAASAGALAWYEFSGVTPVIPANTSFIRFEVSPPSGELPSATHWYGVTSATTAGTEIFDGSSDPGGLLSRTRWLGPVNSSESVREVRSQFGSPAKQAKLVAGPWIGGQGHSGCRFTGTPSYVNNGPVEGGRVGFAASFVEVGSWVYG